MKYLVMECGLSYAVVVDSEGRFLKVPNLGYEVGQVLDCVVIQASPPKHQMRRKRFTRWVAIAACLCLMVLGGWGFWHSPVGTVRMQINPDVQMIVNRFDRVVGLEGLNEDGKALIEAYHFYGKAVETVSDELADRAMKMGFLQDGGQITLTIESHRENWKTVTEEMLLLELDVHFEHRITIVTIPANASDQSGNSPLEPDILPKQTDDSYDNRNNDATRGNDSGEDDKTDDDWDDDESHDRSDDDQDDTDNDDRGDNDDDGSSTGSDDDEQNNDDGDDDDDGD